MKPPIQTKLDLLYRNTDFVNFLEATGNLGVNQCLNLESSGPA